MTKKGIPFKSATYDVLKQIENSSNIFKQLSEAELGNYAEIGDESKHLTLGQTIFHGIDTADKHKKIIAPVALGIVASTITFPALVYLASTIGYYLSLGGSTGHNQYAGYVNFGGPLKNILYSLSGSSRELLVSGASPKDANLDLAAKSLPVVAEEIKINASEYLKTSGVVGTAVGTATAVIENAKVIYNDVKGIGKKIKEAIKK